MNLLQPQIISNTFTEFCFSEYSETLSKKIKHPVQLKQHNFILQKKTENFLNLLLIENQLKKKQFEYLNILYKNNSYRGLRHKRNLPVRGQRTHTNAQTQKKIAKFRLNFKQKNETTTTS
jgi:ribosomal protein S13